MEKGARSGGKGGGVAENMSAGEAHKRSRFGGVVQASRNGFLASHITRTCIRAGRASLLHICFVFSPREMYQTQRGGGAFGCVWCLVELAR